MLQAHLQRKEWIDAYKGLCIMLVVLGHLEINPTLYRVIFSFHMYSFFFISGVTFKGKQEKSMLEYGCDMAKRLLIPYLFFAFMWDATHQVIQLYAGNKVDFSAAALLKNALSVLLGGAWFESGAAIGPAWFLCAMFVVKVAYCWLNTVFDSNMKSLGYICLSLFVIGYLLNGIDILPYSIIPSLTSFVFVYLGDVYRRFAWDNKFEGMRTHWCIIGALICFVIVTVVALRADKDLLLVSNVLPSNVLNTIICAVLGCVGLLFAAKSVCGGGMGKIVATWGRDSMIIMGTHSEIHMAFRMLLERAGLRTEQTVLPVFFITMLISIPIAVVLRKFVPSLVGINKTKAKQ